MEQQLRHQYLDAMGIVSWLPREQLPGALPTPDWVWEFCSLPEDLQPQVAQPQQATAQQSGAAAPRSHNSPQNQQAAQQARAALAASLGDKPVTKVAPASIAPVQSDSSSVEPSIQQAVQQVVDKTTPATTVIAPPALDKAFDAANIAAPEASVEADTDSDAQAPFKLAFVAFGDCLVIDTLPPQSRQGLSLQHQSLLEKILRSVGLEGGQGEVFLLPWPMFASKTLDQGATQARKAVMHKLNKSLASRPVSQVLLFGEAAAQMIIQRSEPLEQLRGILFSLRSDVKVLASASLSEMMTVPGCKKDVWRDLQPMLQHIHSVTPIENSES